MADQSSLAIIRFNQRSYASGGVAAVVKDHGMAERIVTEFDANRSEMSTRGFSA
jgi:hypothetical protein